MPERVLHVTEVDMGGDPVLEEAPTDLPYVESVRVAVCRDASEAEETHEEDPTRQVEQTDGEQDLVLVRLLGTHGDGRGFSQAVLMDPTDAEIMIRQVALCLLQLRGHDPT